MQNSVGGKRRRIEDGTSQPQNEAELLNGSLTPLNTKTQGKKQLVATLAS